MHTACYLQLFISYVDPMSDRQTRRQQLQSQYYFTCQCALCCDDVWVSHVTCQCALCCDDVWVSYVTCQGALFHDDVLGTLLGTTVWCLPGGMFS